MDSGSYSYNPESPELHDELSGTRGHNTIMFDGHEQMPSVSRFLRSHWFKPESESFDSSLGLMSAAYRDWRDAWHKRAVQRTEYGVKIVDECIGFKHKAELRWKLPERDWILKGNCLKSGGVRIVISSTESLDICLESAQFSSNYLKLSDAVVLLVTLRTPGSIVSSFFLDDL